MAEEHMGHDFHFVGGHLCLDFVNTQVVESGGEAVDLLGSFDDMAAWCARAHVINAAQAKEMMHCWSGEREADKAFAQAVTFRATLRGMAKSIVAGRAVPQATLDGINHVLRARVGSLELVRIKQGYETQFRPRFSEPAQLLVPIAESAAALLSDGDLTLVRKCQNPRCILYFYDTTKNHARRWCSMTACGNRAKVAAHYRRTRDDAEAD